MRKCRYVTYEVDAPMLVFQTNVFTPSGLPAGVIAAEYTQDACRELFFADVCEAVLWAVRKKMTYIPVAVPVKEHDIFEQEFMVNYTHDPLGGLVRENGKRSPWSAGVAGPDQTPTHGRSALEPLANPLAPQFFGGNIDPSYDDDEADVAALVGDDLGAHGD